MAFFEELTKKARDVAEIVAEKAKDAAEVVSEKAKDVGEIAKISVEILSEQRELEKNYRAIGEWFVSEYEGELPDAVKVLYGAIIEALPAVLGGVRGGERVASFSNGVDSFTFDLASIDAQLDGQLGWLLDMLPVEWMSECAAYEGGADAR